MLISASRRTDIPAFYTPWLLHRLRDGFACVRNPMNPRQVSRIALTPDVVDGLILWTKNPTPLLPHLDALRDYLYIFQFTLTAYGRDIEGAVPSKNDVLIPAFQELARRIGPERMIWRYDPILFTPTYTPEYHLHYFAKIARRLTGCTSRCVISFIDMYRSIAAPMREIGLYSLPEPELRAFAGQLAAIARDCGMVMETCAEKIDLEDVGIRHGHCIDPRHFELLIGCGLKLSRDKNQREECGCAASIDIGSYGTCPGGCLYCYANHSVSTLMKNRHAYDPASPILCDTLTAEDVVREREVKPIKRC
ncbi:MAG: DUF1848 domain-containing protein [Ruminococcaceae bacterium]|nr:DUF1848 domain-containing protein [Oscillospiraceae bacterium]